MSQPAPNLGRELSVRRIRFWQPGRDVRQVWSAYAPCVDVLVDKIRAAGPIVRFAVLNLVMPLYFAREQGWAIPGDIGTRPNAERAALWSNDYGEGSDRYTIMACWLGGTASARPGQTCYNAL